MIVINETYYELFPDKILSGYCDPKDVLFFDIETTGLDKKSTNLYLIGCGFYRDGRLSTRFYFGETPNEEAEVLKSFFSFASSFKCLIHFNGTKFDLPYLDFKALKYNMPNPLKTLQSIDLYHEIKPLRYLIFRESMRQKCVEDFLGIERKDKYNGGELIPIYFKYADTKDGSAFEDLMMHNREDVLGMHKMIPILHMLSLKDTQVSFLSSEKHNYDSLDGTSMSEMILTFSIDCILPASFSVTNKDLYFKFNAVDNTMKIRVPLYSGTKRHYYENYCDYWYLPDEETCIHKSVAMSVDSGHRTKATKDTCYTSVTGIFMPQPSLVFPNSCGDDYKSRNSYFLIPPSFEREITSDYGKALLDNLLVSKPKRHRS